MKEDLTGYYEKLRTMIFEQQISGMGVDLFQKKGMTTWIHTWLQYFPQQKNEESCQPIQSISHSVTVEMLANFAS